MNKIKIKVNRYHYKEAEYLFTKQYSLTKEACRSVTIAALATHIPLIALCWYISNKFPLQEVKDQLEYLLSFYKAEVDES